MSSINHYSGRIDWEWSTFLNYECGKPQDLRRATHTLNLITTTDTAKAIAQSLDLSETHEIVMIKCNSLWKSLHSPKKNEALRNHLGVALKRPVIKLRCSLAAGFCKDKLSNSSGGRWVGFRGRSNDSGKFATYHQPRYIGYGMNALLGRSWSIIKDTSRI